MIGSVPSEHARTAHTILQNIFIFNKSRGEHASGFSALHLNNKGKLISEKRPIDAIKFVERSSKFKALGKNMPNIFVGHTRFSTSGSPGRNRNNHPFNSDRYSMVHNGGISEWRKIARLNNVKMRSETDSEIILRLVERRRDFLSGIKLTMDIVGHSSRIAVAMIKHVGEPRLFLFRNSYNPIHIMPYPRLHTIFFSSEKYHLKNALRGIYGDDTDKMMLEHDVSIEEVPYWKSLEFKVTNDGRPILDIETEIERPSTSSSTALGFSPYKSYKEYTQSSSIEVDNSDVFDTGVKSSLPVVQGQNGKRSERTDINEMSTGDMLKRVSKDTRARSIELSRSVRESTKVLESIRAHPFMQYAEIEHFKKWMEHV